MLLVTRSTTTETTAQLSAHGLCMRIASILELFVRQVAVITDAATFVAAVASAKIS